MSVSALFALKQVLNFVYHHCFTFFITLHNALIVVLPAVPAATLTCCFFCLQVERPSFSIERLRRHTVEANMDGLSSKGTVQWMKPCQATGSAVGQLVILDNGRWNIMQWQGCRFPSVRIWPLHMLLVRPDELQRFYCIKAVDVFFVVILENAQLLALNP